MTVNDFLSSNREIKKTEGLHAELIPVNSNIYELRYYETNPNKSYRSWKISLPVIIALCSFWKTYKTGLLKFPINERVSEAEFRMFSEKSVFIKESDIYGNLNMIGSDLPVKLVESLFIEMSEKKLL